MAWVTMPALIGPVLGPAGRRLHHHLLLWHWIFLINVPIGLLGIVLATRYIPDVRAEGHERFDVVGMILAGLGIGGVAFGLSVLGLNFLPWFVVVALVVGGACFIAAYLAHARRTENPALDLTLFRSTFFASVVGDSHIPPWTRRAAVSAPPHVADRLWHDAFSVRHDHFRDGAWRRGNEMGGCIYFAALRLSEHSDRQFGDQRSLPSHLRGFLDDDPIAVMMVLFVGGFFRSLQFTSINTIAYADVEPERVGRRLRS